VVHENADHHARGLSHAHCSNLLVMENVARADAKGKFEEIDAK
jgi:hypothetical protein